MIDYKELRSKGPRGEGLEQLTRLLLKSLGMIVEWSGRGADQGKDLLATESTLSPICAQSTRWLVSCKDNSEAGSSVAEADLPAICDKLRQHRADGFLLVTTTTPSTSAKALLDGQISGDVKTAVWDRAELDRMLLQPEHSSLLKQFFPKSFSNVQQLGPTETALPSLANLPDDVIRRVTEALAPYARMIRFGHSIWPEDSARASEFERICDALIFDEVDIACISAQANPDFVDVITRTLSMLDDRGLQSVGEEFAEQLMRANPQTDCALNAFQYLIDHEIDPVLSIELTEFLDGGSLAFLYGDEVGAFVQNDLVANGSNYSLWSSVDALSGSTSVSEMNLDAIEFSSDGERIWFRGSGMITCELVYDWETRGELSFPGEVEGYIDSTGISIEDATIDTSSFYEEDEESLV